MLKKTICPFFISLFVFSACTKSPDNTTTGALTITTTAAGSITHIAAGSGGNITGDGGSAITSRGIVWDLNHNPTTLLSTKTTDGSGTGSFTSTMVNLLPSTTYYVRSYAINTAGVQYGNEVSFITLPMPPYSFVMGAPVTDIDGNIYPTIITSCGQTWMQRNLTTAHYRNGEMINNITSSPIWSTTVLPAWCWYNNDGVTYADYGKLYNWYAATDVREIAPAGWHIPTTSDWNKLIKCIDPAADTNCNTCITSYRAGGALKETGLSHWLSPNVTGALNAGFNALPGGYRYAGMSIDFTDIKFYGHWWTKTQYNSTHTSTFHLFNYDSIIAQNNYSKYFGYSVRCVKD